MAEEKVKKSKGAKIIILLVVVLIILIALGVGGYFGYNSYKNSIKIDTDWGEKYFEHLNLSRKNETSYEPTDDGGENERDYYKNAKNAKVQFIQADEEKDMPLMLVSFERNDLNYFVICEEKNGNMDEVMYPNSSYSDEHTVKTELKLLYNMKYDRYLWYIHLTDDEGVEQYESLIDMGASNGLGNVYRFNAEGINLNYEDVFIDVDNVDYSATEIGDLNNISELNLKKCMETAVVNYKDESQIVTDEIKTTTETKKTELEAKQAEEQAKKEAEEKAAAEEAARKTAEEEAKKGLKVGNYTLKYGTYKCDYGGETFTINQDGTFTYKNIWTNYKDEKFTDTASGKYSVYFSEGDDYDPKKSWIIKFNFSKYHSTYEPSNSYPHDFLAFDVSGNNKFQYRQSVGTFTYQGN